SDEDWRCARARTIEGFARQLRRQERDEDRIAAVGKIRSLWRRRQRARAVRDDAHLARGLVAAGRQLVLPPVHDPRDLPDEEQEREPEAKPFHGRLLCAMTRVTTALLIANVLVFGLETQIGDPLMSLFALWPLGHGFAVWQIVTSAFLHANVGHLFTN